MLDFINDNQIVQKVEKLGNYFFSELNKLAHKYPKLISEIRGKGFMIGIEIKNYGNKLVEQLRNENILVNLTADNVIRLLPPLIVEQAHLDIFLNHFEEIINKL